MNHPKHERTLVLIKPDAVQRSLIGEIIGRFERIGLKLIAMKMIVPSPEMVEQHYTLDPQWRKVTGEKTLKAFAARGEKAPTDDPEKMSDLTLQKLRKYMSSGPVVAMIWQGAHAVPIVRKLVGSTEPLASDVGTIRGDFVLDSYELSEGDNRSIRNLIHASGSVKEAEDEIKHWFMKDEIQEYRLVQEAILYEDLSS